jgi:hypothetical protein
MSTPFNKEGCCKCIATIRQQIKDLYSRIQALSIEKLNGITASLNGLTSPIASSCEEKLRKTEDGLTGKYQRIIDDLRDKNQGLLERAIPLCERCELRGKIGPGDDAMRDFWDKLKPPPFVANQFNTPEQRGLEDEPLKRMDDGRKPELPPPDRLPQASTTVASRTPKPGNDCPPFYGLTCCPISHLDWQEKPEEEKQKKKSPVDIPPMMMRNPTLAASTVTVSEESESAVSEDESNA